MKARTFLPLAVLTPLLLASRWAGDRPSFQPKVGATLTKNFVQEFEMELDDMSMELDGKDVSSMAGQIQMAMKVTSKLSVTDQYDAVEGGRPTKLKRSYDAIDGNTHMSTSMAIGDMPDSENDLPMSSELEGETVTFTWDDGASSYETAFDDGAKGDEELESLEEDLDLRGLLPTAEVAKGDTWKLPIEAVKAALHPGGDVKLRPETSNDMAGGMDMSPSEMIGDPEGEFTATYEGTREEDGVRVAVIKVVIDLKSAQDMSAKLDEMKEKMAGNLPAGVQVDVTAFDTEIEMTAEGELLWNLESGLVHGLHLSGEVRTIVDLSVNMAMGDRAQAMEQSMTFSGTQTLTLTTGS
jgi:hypothetical protein